MLDFSVRQWSDKAKTRPRYFKAECHTCHARRERRRWSHQRTTFGRSSQAQARSFFVWLEHNSYRWQPVCSASQPVDVSPPRPRVARSAYNDDCAYYFFQSLYVVTTSAALPGRGQRTAQDEYVDALEFRASDDDLDPRALETTSQWLQLHPDVRAAIGKRSLWPVVRNAYPGGFEAIMNDSSVGMLSGLVLAA